MLRPGTWPGPSRGTSTRVVLLHPLLTASHVAYEVLRWAGAGYLAWMGMRMLLDTWLGRSVDGATDPLDAPTGTESMGLLLAGVHILLGLTWSAVLIAFARGLRGWLSRPQARRLLDRITGTVITGFGLRLATSD